MLLLIQANSSLGKTETLDELVYEWVAMNVNSREPVALTSDGVALIFCIIWRNISDQSTLKYLKTEWRSLYKTILYRAKVDLIGLIFKSSNHLDSVCDIGYLKTWWVCLAVLSSVLVHTARCCYLLRIFSRLTSCRRFWPPVMFRYRRADPRTMSLSVST